ncbi:MAG: flagellar biosynthetic protein FliQ [Candidatus Eremiobacteraeota bacterium]|nr:flagellar biosynthetic protein FliQ [Candidatus Eremiobacteraeota bacterium]
MDAFSGLLREALVVTAVLCVPVLLLATLAGTAIAILQAATSVQEQTISLLPKLLLVGIALAAFGPFGMHLCAGLFEDVLARIPELAHG